MTLRDPKKCEICGELFIPKQGRSPICGHPECFKIRQRQAQARALAHKLKFKKKVTFKKRATIERSCVVCGSGFLSTSGSGKFCPRESCQNQKRDHANQRSWIYRRSLIGSQKAKVHEKRTQDKVRSLHQTCSFMSEILEGWINTIFTERDQVELVFLESSHLRGCRNSLISSDLRYNGGYIGEGIFPNRGARA